MIITADSWECLRYVRTQLHIIIWKLEAERIFGRLSWWFDSNWRFVPRESGKENCQEIWNGRSLEYPVCVHRFLYFAEKKRWSRGRPPWLSQEVGEAIFGCIIYRVPIDAEEIGLESRHQTWFRFRDFAVGAGHRRAVQKGESRTCTEARQVSYVCYL